MNKFKIHFSGGNHGCGCGCDDNDLNIADQNIDKDFDYSGTYEDAKKELEQLKNAHGKYGCDWGDWTLSEEKNKSRLVVLSGPSGVGKGMMIDWMLKLAYPDFYDKNDRYRKDKIDLCIVPVYKVERGAGGNAGQSVYGRSNSKNTYPFNCRGRDQEIDVDELDNAIENHRTTVIEAYYKAFDFLKNRYSASIDFASTFVSPLNADEIKELNEQAGLENYLPDLMLDSLVRRAERDGKAFSRALVRELEQRAEDSINEIKIAHNYRQVIPNHCYESDPRWRFPLLIGEPRRVVTSLKDIITNGRSDYSSNGIDFIL